MSAPRGVFTASIIIIIIIIMITIIVIIIIIITITITITTTSINSMIISTRGKGHRLLARGIDEPIRSTANSASSGRKQSTGSDTRVCSPIASATGF